MRVVVVYVHGLWLPGGEAFLLRRRLARELDAQTRTFTYRSVRSSWDDNAARLGRFLRGVSADALHLVAHSMGGLLILRLFERGMAADLPPGRIVFTGSPVRGSRSAERLARLPFGRALLGRTASEVLLIRGERRWQGDRELGVIAGDLAVGLGRILGPIDAPNDGTVWVDETDLPGATQQIRVPVSHSGLVFSPEVARQTAAFLRDGRFLASR
jgi:pimeloyl-ACP methyl ester carboxylesterase